MKVGIFDSGVGGLTVYGTLKKRYPFCDLYISPTRRIFRTGINQKKRLFRILPELLIFFSRKNVI